MELLKIYKELKVKIIMILNLMEDIIISDWLINIHKFIIIIIYKIIQKLSNLIYNYNIYLKKYKKISNK